MNEEELKNKLIELIRVCGGTPPEPKNNSLEDYFIFLRTYIKYLLFDLEATRRENEFLEKKNKELRIRLTAIGGIG